MSKGIHLGMPYKRQSRPYWRSSTPTLVNICWSQQYNAYACKWQDTHHFQEMTPVISYFKSKPYGDCVYDPDNKIWYFKEQYLLDVSNMLSAFGPTIFEVKSTGKPQQNHSLLAHNFVSADTYLTRFKELTNEDIKNLDYNDAKKIYRRVCMRMHPDYNPGNIEIAAKMSSVNEIWTELERVHFNTKKEPEYNVS